MWFIKFLLLLLVKLWWHYRLFSMTIRVQSDRCSGMRNERWMLEFLQATTPHYKIFRSSLRSAYFTVYCNITWDYYKWIVPDDCSITTNQFILIYMFFFFLSSRYSVWAANGTAVQSSQSHITAMKARYYCQPAHADFIRGCALSWQIVLEPDQTAEIQLWGEKLVVGSRDYISAYFLVGILLPPVYWYSEGTSASRCVLWDLTAANINDSHIISRQCPPRPSGSRSLSHFYYQLPLDCDISRCFDAFQCDNPGKLVW